MKYRRGAIILELLMATVLIGVAIMAIYLALIYGQTSLVRTKHQTIASQLANQELERLRSLDYQEITAPYNGPFLSGANIAGQLPNGAGSLTVTLVNDSTTLKEATARVSWTERGIVKTVSQTSLYSAYGLNYE